MGADRVLEAPRAVCVHITGAHAEPASPAPPTGVRGATGPLQTHRDSPELHGAGAPASDL